jgi:hypothetical protein
MAGIVDDPDIHQWRGRADRIEFRRRMVLIENGHKPFGQAI